MPHFVIAGKPDCAKFIHAVQIAKYLSENLPDVTFSKVENSDMKWIKLIEELKRKNGWCYIKSPIIWKEVAMTGGKPHLIGDLGDFWEYIDDYYGIFTCFDRETIEKLKDENFLSFKKKIKDNRINRTQCRVISIYGVNKYSTLLLGELFNVPNLIYDNLVIIKLYETNSHDANIRQEILDMIEDLNETLVTNVRYSIHLEVELSKFIENTDLLLIAKNFSQKYKEPQDDWLQRIHLDMVYLSSFIEKSGKISLRIILCHPGPTCFNANVLSMNITNEKIKRNLVAISSHEGLRILGSISRINEIDVGKLGAPPVWGLSGICPFVDVKSTFYMKDIIRPYLRAFKNVPGSTLPQERVTKELSILSCTVDVDEIVKDANLRRKFYTKVNRNPIFPLLRATLKMLELWYAKNTFSEEVISLGVTSDGSFGIDKGLIFSQPCCLDREKIWRPYAQFPILDESNVDIQNAVTMANDVMKKLQNFYS